MTKRLSLPIVAFCAMLAGTAGAAIPKAAEDESAPVTVGADAPKPKKRALKPTPTQKKKPAGHVRKIKKVRHDHK